MRCEAFERTESQLSVGNSLSAGHNIYYIYEGEEEMHQLAKWRRRQSLKNLRSRALYVCS